MDASLSDLNKPIETACVLEKIEFVSKNLHIVNA
jgi:hypothetical protein